MMAFLNDDSSYYLLFVNGIMITCMLTIASVSIGLGLAIVITTVRYLGNRLLRKIGDAAIFFICGTPLLVQIFLLYFGFSQFEWIRESVFWVALREPMVCAIIALAINTACYTAVLFEGAIQSLPENELLACMALGMSKCLAFRRIIFVRAFRMALPAYSNEIAIMLKNTSLASTITILDVMGVTQKIISDTYQPFEWFLIASLIYLVLHALVMTSFHCLSVAPAKRS